MRRIAPTDTNSQAIDTALKYHRAGRLAQAEAIYRQVLGTTPEHPDALHLLGMIAHQTGNHQAAIDLINRAIEADPANPFYYNNIGGVYRALGQHGQAIENYRKALALKTDLPEACNNLGISLKELGRHNDALGAYRKALSLKPDYAEAQWSYAMMQIPPVYDASGDMATARASFSRELGKLENWLTGSMPSGAPQAVGSHQPFYLAYQEENNRDLLSRYGVLCARLMAQHRDIETLPAAQTHEDGTIRIGVVSAHIQEHSVWNAIVRGWFEHLDRRRFELHAFHVGTKQDAQTRWARTRSTSYVTGLANLRQWVQAILGKQPHVLIYPEIGMDPLTIRLASLRLAPVQVATWGHPETTGLPTMDYYLSAEDLEPPGAQANYTEKLVRLPGLGCCYRPDAIDPSRPDLAGLGIDPDRPLLVCPGTPFKYTPPHDRIFTGIARRLGACQFAFFRHPVNEFSRALQHRLGASFRDAGLNIEDYVILLPWLDKPAFHGLLQSADVFLDTVGFSGFNTAIQAIECDLPVVTREGRFMRGRLASGILNRLDLAELVASDNDNYVDIVERLVKDSEYNMQIRQRIRRNRHALFDDTDVVRALETFLAGAVEEHPH